MRRKYILTIGGLILIFIVGGLFLISFSRSTVSGVDIKFDPDKNIVLTESGFIEYIDREEGAIVVPINWPQSDDLNNKTPIKITYTEDTVFEEQHPLQKNNTYYGLSEIRDITADDLNPGDYISFKYISAPNTGLQAIYILAGNFLSW